MKNIKLFVLLGLFQSFLAFGDTLDVRVNASNNDAEERVSSGSMSLSSSDLELITDGSNAQLVGMRFTGLNIPQGAQIQSATIQFTTDEVSTGAVSLTVRAQAADTAAAFTSSRRNLSSRVLTGASVSWVPLAWSVVNEAGTNQRTPDLSSVVQEVVNQSGWTASSNLAIVITGSGRRTAKAYNGSSSQAPLLHIEYTTTPGEIVEDPVPDSFSFVAQTNVSLSAIVTSNTVALSGFNVPQAAFVTGDGSPVLIINGVVSANGILVQSGDTLAVNLTSASTLSVTRSATVSINTVSSRFDVTTLTAATNYYRLMWKGDPATSVVVGWNSISGLVADRRIYYDTVDHGTDVAAYAFVRSADSTNVYRGMNNTFARLTGLIPNTAYYFVISDTNGNSNRFWFKTAPADSSERLSFISGGDSRNNRIPRQNANTLVKKLRPHAVLFSGDMTDGGEELQWREWFDDWQLTNGEDGRMIPLVVARGNHEGSNEMLEKLFDTDPNVYYSVSVGGDLVRIYTLNTELPIAGDQTTWLTSDLESNTNVRWKFAQYHKPMRPHTSSKPEGTAQYANWAELFYNNSVNLVIESDSHVVKSTWPVRPSTEAGSDEGFIRDDNGTTYIGEGGWGAPLRSANDLKDWTRDAGSFNHFQWIFVDRSQIEIRVIRVDNASSVGEVSDADIFTPPANLDIWNPNNGAVTVIEHNNIRVSVDSPLANEQYSEPQEITLSATAEADEGFFTQVEFFVNGSSVGIDPEVPYSMPWFIPADGTYSITAAATHSSGVTRTSTPVEIRVGTVVETIDVRVNASNNDAEERVSSGSMSLSSSDLELIADGSNAQLVGMRFTGLNIPQGAQIQSATIQFTTDEVSTGAVSLTVRAQAADTAAAFTSSRRNLSSRVLTGASVSWVPLAWSVVNEAGTNQRTPDLSSVVQEVVNQSGWTASSNLAIVITGSGRRTAKAYNGSSSQAPLLHVEYIQ